jgi:molecular chaperone DnaK
MTEVGIDLGTSSTVVAVVKNGDPVTLCDADGRRSIPSIVSFHPSGNILVGDAARMRRYNDPANTITGAKRLMGRTWGSPELEEMRSRIPYELSEGKNKTVRVKLRGEQYSVPELSAFVLRKAKAWAEESLGDKVAAAVITVPANFNELQRQATRLAGDLAGIEVLRILNEPTAAALAYSQLAPWDKEEQIAVYDFGGGTFDLTMLRMNDQALRVRATAGNMFLGGDDVDLAIARGISDAFLREHRYDCRTDPEVFARLRTAAERLKVDLSTDTTVSVTLNDLTMGPGGKSIPWSYTLTRAELDKILDPFIDQSLKVCGDALTLLKSSVKDFDRVVLVGGTTLSPRVRQRVGEFFGREPVHGVDPEEAVALGAAISATIPVARKAKAMVQPRPISSRPPPLLTLDDDDIIPDYPMSERAGEEGEARVSLPPPAPSAEVIKPTPFGALPVTPLAKPAAVARKSRAWVWVVIALVILGGVVASVLYLRIGR